MDLLSHTASPIDIDAKDFDAIYFTGGHAVMFDYPDDEGLQQLTREIYEAGVEWSHRFAMAIAAY